jgi:hypothetical protein
VATLGVKQPTDKATVGLFLARNAQDAQVDALIVWRASWVVLAEQDDLFFPVGQQLSFSGI